MADYGQILKGAGVSLDRAVTQQFGSAVEQYTRGVLGTAINGKATTSPQPNAVSDPTVRRDPRDWISSSYAAHLATGDFRPKLKFLFKVEFKFKQSVLAELGELGKRLGSGEYTFLITKVDRPKFEFEYEDSVNQYNFNTKVLRRIKHRELTMSFMDDTGNRVFDFFSAMVLLFSPVVTQDVAVEGAGSAALWPSEKNPMKYQLGSGMAFSGQQTVQVGNVGTNDLANRRAVLSDAGTALECIRVKQMFTDTSDGVKPKFKEVIFDFVNPRIMSFDMDELSHEDTNPNILNMTFDFDWMEMVKVENLNGTPSPVMQKALTPEGAPFDILGNQLATTEPGVPSQKPGNNNPYINIAAGVARQTAQRITNETVNRVVKSIPGNGRFASVITQPIGNAIAGTLTSQIGSKTNSFIADTLVPGLSKFGTSLVGGSKSTTPISSPPVIDSASPRSSGSSTDSGGG